MRQLHGTNQSPVQAQLVRSMGSSRIPLFDGDDTDDNNLATAEDGALVCDNRCCHARAGSLGTGWGDKQPSFYGRLVRAVWKHEG